MLEPLAEEEAVSVEYESPPGGCREEERGPGLRTEEDSGSLGI